MKLRLARLTLAASIATLVAAPLTATSHAMVCNPDFEVACVIVDTVCLHGKLCQFE